MPTDSGDPTAIYRALRALVRLQDHRDRLRAASYGLSAAGADALDAVSHLGPISLNRLAAELVVDKSTACRVVALLEDRGWLVRTADPHDGRALRLQLTDEGRALQTEIAADASWEAQAVWRALPQAARDGAPGVLAAWAQVAAAHAGVAAPDPSPVSP